MTNSPVRSDLHDALEAFVGRWSAHGTSYGGTDQSGADPKANGQSWVSTHDGYWHTRRFFLVQDEKADIAGSRFDTLSFMGLDEDGSWFARSFENHGFYRHYNVSWEGQTWRLDGELERAAIRFKEGGRKQVITWEWKQGDAWLPLCDRVAVRVD